MKKSKLMQHFLAWTLALTMVASEAVPVFAAGNSVNEATESEATESEAIVPEAAGSVGNEADSSGAASQASVIKSAGLATAVKATVGEFEGTKPTLSNPVVSVVESYSNSFKLQVTYTAQNCASVDLEVKDSAGKVVARYSKFESGDTVSIGSYDNSLKAGARYTVELTGTSDPDEDGDTDEVKSSAVWTVPSVTLSAPVITVDSVSSNYMYLKVQYTTTNYDGNVSLSVKNAAGVEVYSDSWFSSGDTIRLSNFGTYDTSNPYDPEWMQYEVKPGEKFTVTLTADGYDPKTSQTTWTAPSVATVTGLSVKENSAHGFVFSHSVVPKDAYIRYQLCGASDFNDINDPIEEFSGDSLSYTGVELEELDLEPGTTYYVRAYFTYGGIKGAYSNVISLTPPVAEVTNVTTEVNKTSVKLTMSTSYGKFTGFQVYRKVGKKYKEIVTTTDTSYTDKGLKNATKYTYKVRAYYYNLATKKKTYGDPYIITVKTGKYAMNLKAVAASKSSIKLSWSKIAGASGYDVYRVVSSSYTSKLDPDKTKNAGFKEYELVKSLSKSKKSYTDKKLESGESYTYIVKAYKKEKKEKVYYTEASATATTKFGFSVGPEIYKKSVNPKNGKVSIAWTKVPQASGYLVEKKAVTSRDEWGDVSGTEWVTYKKLTKASKTSCTLPASPLGETVRYRVRAYKGKKYSEEADVDVTGSLATVTGVKATSSADGIKVSWKAVPGAAYYRVYRTTSSYRSYNTDTKTYNYVGDQPVTPTVFKAVPITENPLYYTTLPSNASLRYEHDYEAERALRYHYPQDVYKENQDKANANIESWDKYVDYGVQDSVVGTSIMDYASTYHSPLYNAQGVAYQSRDTLNGPQQDVSYYYYVVAYAVQPEKDANGQPYKNEDGQVVYITDGESYGNSNAAVATLKGAASIKAPTSVKAKAGKKSVTVSFKKVSGAKKYEIWRATSKKGTYELVTTTTKTSYKDKGLKAKKKYYYKVRSVAVNSLQANTFSSYSAVKSAKTKK